MTGGFPSLSLSRGLSMSHKHHLEKLSRWPSLLISAVYRKRRISFMELRVRLKFVRFEKLFNQLFKRLLKEEVNSSHFAASGFGLMEFNGVQSGHTFSANLERSTELKEFSRFAVTKRFTMNTKKLLTVFSVVCEVRRARTICYETFSD